MGMRGQFRSPRPAESILGTYRCLLFHAGLLRNGWPGPNDTHALHGEMPVARMDGAWVHTGVDAVGPYLRLVCTVSTPRDSATTTAPRPG
jgi:hypothetical protein